MLRSCMRLVVGRAVAAGIRRLSLFGLVLLLTSAVSQPAEAVLIVATSQGNSQTFFPAQNDDEMNAGQPTYDAGSSTVTGFTAGGGSSINGLNDGTLGTPSTTSSANTWGADDSNYTRTFVFDTTSNTLGYEVTQINSIAAWTTDRYQQEYTLEYSTVDAPAVFLSLASVNYRPTSLGGNNATLVTFTDDTGFLATSVKALRFNFLDDGRSVYQEIDVFANAILPAPEPSTLLLIGLPALVLLKRNRRRTARSL